MTGQSAGCLAGIGDRTRRNVRNDHRFEAELDHVVGAVGSENRLVAVIDRDAAGIGQLACAEGGAERRCGFPAGAVAVLGDFAPQSTYTLLFAVSIPNARLVPAKGFGAKGDGVAVPAFSNWSASNFVSGPLGQLLTMQLRWNRSQLSPGESRYCLESQPRYLPQDWRSWVRIREPCQSSNRRLSRFLLN